MHMSHALAALVAPSLAVLIAASPVVPPVAPLVVSEDVSIRGCSARPESAEEDIRDWGLAIDGELVATHDNGDSDVAGAGLEWRSQSGDGAMVLVTAEPFDGRTELRVSVDASVPAVGSQLFSTLAGGLLGVAIGASVDPGAVAGIALVAGTAGVGLGVGRLIWWKRLRSNAVARSKKIFSAAMSALPAAPPHR